MHVIRSLKVGIPFPNAPLTEELLPASYVCLLAFFLRFFFVVVVSVAFFVALLVCLGDAIVVFCSFFFIFLPS